MNEIDLYIELLDDKAASAILRDFKETVPGFSKNATLKQKKNHLKSVFRGQTVNMRRKKLGDPFFHHLSAYRNAKNDERFGSYDAKGLIRLLANSDEVPEHAKLAIALTYHPEEVREALPQWVENIQSNRRLLDSNDKFDTQEEVEAFLLAGMACFGEKGLERLLERLSGILIEEQVKQLEELEAVIGPMTLTEFHNAQQQFKELPPHLPFYAYAKTHPEEKEWIRTGMTFQVLLSLLKEQKSLNDELKGRLASSVEQARSLEELKLESKELTEKLKESEKGRRQGERDKRELEEQLVKLEQEWLRKATQLEQTISAQRKESEYSLSQQQKELEQAKRQQLEVSQQMKGFEEECSGESPFDHFAVVYTGDMYMFHTIFPEVTAFHFKEWSQHKSKLLGFPKVYIQRDGLNSKLIQSIQSYCRKSGIEPFFFISRNEKDLIEHIAYYKKIALEV